jgi:hypothetical protein
LRRVKKSTHQKAEDEWRENGNDGPDAEDVSDGCDPRVRVIVPKIISVAVPDIGRCREHEGGHDLRTNVGPGCGLGDNGRLGLALSVSCRRGPSDKDKKII